MAEVIRMEIEMLKGNLVTLEQSHEQRLQLVEQEVLKMQRRPEYNGSGNRDKLIMKKGLGPFRSTAARTTSTTIGAFKQARS